MEKKIYMLVVGDFADKDIEAVFDNEEDLQKYLNEFQIYDLPMRVEVKYLNPKPSGKTEPDYNDERYPVFEKKKS
ncbi:hypothetical protein V2E39_17300 [Chryseobacterium arthrosphaerae]|uniref:DUF177 domain-containing protein n=1 Tax=Chryseobacterium arthrosphaerae TaxID=651561 RepID=A0ABU7R318_9FLAO